VYQTQVALRLNIFQGKTALIVLPLAMDVNPLLQTVFPVQEICFWTQILAKLIVLMELMELPTVANPAIRHVTNVPAQEPTSALDVPETTV
jgi:hypothetical protein